MQLRRLMQRILDPFVTAPGGGPLPRRGRSQLKGPRLSRINRFLEAHASTETQGLEIGPFDRPILPRPAWKVFYADVYTTDHLRKLAAMNPNRVPENVVEIDFVLADQSLAQAIKGQGVDFVFGSHVYEHFPNLLGAFRDLAHNLQPGGRIIGAFPDRRFTYDIDRPRTTLGQLLERDRLSLTQPDPQSVFDHFFHFRPINTGKIWAHGHDDAVARQHSLATALTRFEQAKGGYVDCHCNLFTDDEFADMVDAFPALDISLRLAALEPTDTPLNEFFFALEKTQ